MNGERICCECGGAIVGPDNEDAHDNRDKCVRNLRAQLVAERARTDEACTVLDDKAVRVLLCEALGNANGDSPEWRPIVAMLDASAKRRASVSPTPPERSPK